MLKRNWISATETYNYMMNDPVLDWYREHYSKLNNRKGSNNNGKSFSSYIMEQGCIFENKIMKMITKKFEPDRIAEIHGEKSPRDPKKAEETLEAMKRGVPIIHSGVLHNPENKTFGIPDLLVRSDWLRYLVEDSPLNSEIEIKSAPKLKTDGWHYRVVDIKYTGLLLRANNRNLLNTGSFPAYKAQLLIYNWALGYVQGYTPNEAYILGRRWKYTAKGETFNRNACFDKLGVIDYEGTDSKYIELTTNALKWLRTVRSKSASSWNVNKYPLHRWELYPNMCNTHDGQWHDIKREIADTNKELTDIWMIGPKNRALALNAGVYQWNDPSCTPEILGIHGDKTYNIINSIIQINRSDDIKISPPIISNNIGAWKEPDILEFFIDFESHNGALSSIKKLPESNNDSLIFMIGVGYYDPQSKNWVHKHFTSNLITFNEEARICNEFVDFIKTMAKTYNLIQPRCYHWSGAEETMWLDVIERHNIDYDDWIWVDMLKIFKEEPIVINGCKSFGLKAVASAMHKHGFIDTIWPSKNTKNTCTNGQGAMVLAYKAHRIARQRGIPMTSVSIMKQIISYNEIDVKVLYEILTYLRNNHTSKKRKRSSTTKTQSKKKCI